MVVVIVMVVWIITNIRCLRFLSIFRTALSLSCLCVCHGQRHVTALQLRSDFLVNILSDIKNLALYYYKYEVILSLVPMNKYYCAINFFTYPLFPWEMVVALYHFMPCGTVPYRTITCFTVPYRIIPKLTRILPQRTYTKFYDIMPYPILLSHRTVPYFVS